MSQNKAQKTPPKKVVNKDKKEPQSPPNRDGKADTAEEEVPDPAMDGMGAYDVRLKLHLEVYHGTDGLVEQLAGTYDLSRVLHPRNLSAAKRALRHLAELHVDRPLALVLDELVTKAYEKAGRKRPESAGAHLLESAPEYKDEDIGESEEHEADESFPTAE